MAEHQTVRKQALVNPFKLLSKFVSTFNRIRTVVKLNKKRHKHAIQQCTGPIIYNFEQQQQWSKLEVEQQLVT